MSGEEHPLLIFVLLLALAINVYIGINLGLLIHDLFLKLVKKDPYKMPSFIIKLLVTLGLGAFTIVSTAKSVVNTIRGKHS
jgi:F0F1-type ATP synthase assembly protein I